MLLGAASTQFFQDVWLKLWPLTMFSILHKGGSQLGELTFNTGSFKASNTMFSILHKDDNTQSSNETSFSSYTWFLCFSCYAWSGKAESRVSLFAGQLHMNECNRWHFAHVGAPWKYSKFSRQIALKLIRYDLMDSLQMRCKGIVGHGLGIAHSCVFHVTHDSCGKMTGIADQGIYSAFTSHVVIENRWCEVGRLSHE